MNMSTPTLRAAVLSLLLLGAARPSVAADAPVSLLEHAVLTSPTFLNAHPDLRYRQLGLDAVERARFPDARRYFSLGGQYADKLSQALMAELLWEGKGGAVDRALGYAWMDLAAERGTEWLVVRREQYWAALDEAERKRAVAEGQALYKQYGDPVAKPRQEAAMRRGMGEMTGSRTGALGSTTMQVRYQGQMVKVLPEVFYAPHLWQPDAYWPWQGGQLEAGNRSVVDVGAPKTLRGE